MSDVFDGVPIFDSQGTQRDLAWFRRRFGPNVIGTWPGYRLVKLVTQESSMTGFVQFLTPGGAPDAGRPVRWSWEHGAKHFDDVTDERGVAQWVYGNNEWIDPTRPGTGDHAKGAYSMDSGPVHIEGLGWAAETNHDKPNFVFQEGGALPPPGPGTGVDRAAIDAQLDLLDAASREIRRLAHA